MKSIIIAFAAAAAPLCAAAALPADSLLTGHPYLQNPVADAITVMYTSPEGHQIQSWVEYTADTTATPQRARQLYAGQEVVHSPIHRVRLTGLTPGGTYYYRVRAREITENESYHKEFGDVELVTPYRRFTLPSPTGDSFTAVIVNDTHSYQPTVDAVARLTDSIAPDLVIFNGDCLPEPHTLGDAIEALHATATPFGLDETPAIFIRGNHEIRNAYSSGMPELFDKPGGKTYGAFSWGDTRFITLDCGEDKPDDTWVYYGLNDFNALRAEQADFIREEIAGEPFKSAHRRITVHHIPVWGNTDKYQPCTPLWSPILAAAPIDLDLAAHTHEFKLHAPGEADGNPMPVMVGGGYKPDSATLAIVRKAGDSMTLEVIGLDGKRKAYLEL